MSFKKIGLLLGFVVLIVAVGLFWNQPSEQPSDSPDKPSDKKNLQAPSFDEKNWDVDSEATVDFEEEDGSAEKDVYDRFTVPGRITFDDRTPARKVRLNVQVRPVKPERAADLSAPSPEGDPIAALMQTDPKKTFDTEPISRTITTSSSGRFTVKNAIPGIYTVSVLDTDLIKKEGSSEIQMQSRVNMLEATVTQTARLIGTVVDVDGDPLTATVEYLDGSGSFETDEKGQFTIDNVPPGKKIDSLRIYREGYQSNFLSLPAPKPGETIRETFTLERSSQLRVEVRKKDGTPVRQGKLSLQRLDDEEIPYGAPQSVPHGQGKVTELNNDGAGVFESVIPGRVQVELIFTPYLAEPVTVDVSKGDVRTVKMTVRDGEPFRMKFLDESTGREANDIKPAMRVFDADGNELEPGFAFKEKERSGVYRGTVHPGAETIKMRITSPGNTYREKEVSFSRADLPNLEVRMVPRPDPGVRDDEPPGLVEFNLKNEDRLDWDNTPTANVWILDAETGELVLSRTGDNPSVFAEPFPLELGQYIVYGTVQQPEGPSLVTYSRITVESQHPGSRELSLSESASVRGTVDVDGAYPEGLQVGVSLKGPSESESESPTPDAVFLPESLKTTLDETGSYRLTNLPVGMGLELRILATGKSELDVQSGAVLASRSLPALSAGSERTINTITVSN